MSPSLDVTNLSSLFGTSVVMSTILEVPKIATHIMGMSISALLTNEFIYSGLYSTKS